MAKAPPSIDFYFNDWIGGTHHLSNVEYACYHKLLIYQWQNGHIPLKTIHRMNLCGIVDTGQWEGIWSSISEKFSPVRGEEIIEWTGDPEQVVFVQMRMHEDRNSAIPKWRVRKQVNQENGRRGGRPKKPKQNPFGFENETETKPIPEGGRGKGEEFLKSKEKGMEISVDNLRGGSDRVKVPADVLAELGDSILGLYQQWANVRVNVHNQPFHFFQHSQIFSWLCDSVPASAREELLKAAIKNSWKTLDNELAQRITVSETGFKLKI